MKNLVLSGLVLVSLAACTSQNEDAKPLTPLTDAQTAEVVEVLAGVNDASSLSYQIKTIALSEKLSSESTTPEKESKPQSAYDLTTYWSKSCEFNETKSPETNEGEYSVGTSYWKKTNINGSGCPVQIASSYDTVFESIDASSGTAGVRSDGALNLTIQNMDLTAEIKGLQILNSLTLTSNDRFKSDTSGGFHQERLVTGKIILRDGRSVSFRNSMTVYIRYEDAQDEDGEDISLLKEAKGQVETILDFPTFRAVLTQEIFTKPSDYDKDRLSRGTKKAINGIPLSDEKIEELGFYKWDIENLMYNFLD